MGKGSFALIHLPVAETVVKEAYGIAAMNTYEIIAVVEPNGQIRVAGVPFEVGTEVEVTISPKAPLPEHPQTEDEAWAAAGQRMRQLAAALGQARNTTPTGPLNRAELYDREVLR